MCVCMFVCTYVQELLPSYEHCITKLGMGTPVGHWDDSRLFSFKINVDIFSGESVKMQSKPSGSRC